ncbi:MAG: hypothetical protein ACRC5C_09950, partial [Bacilli bacterium]
MNTKISLVWNVPVAREEGLRQVIASEVTRYTTDANVFVDALLAHESIVLDDGHPIRCVLWHARSETVDTPFILFFRRPLSSEGWFLDAEIAVVVGTPLGDDPGHLALMRNLASALLDTSFMSVLSTSTNSYDLEQQFHAIRRKVRPLEVDGETTLVAITSCEQGLIGTFMAAESLQRAAELKGVRLIVETTHAEGRSNPLSAEDFTEARTVIVAGGAGDVRLEGKPVLFVSVNSAIRDGKRIIEQAIEGDVPIYDGLAEGTEKPRHFFTKLHDYLGAGTAGVYGFVLTGCFLIFISYLFGPEALLVTSEKYSPFARTVLTLGMHVLLPITYPVFVAGVSKSVAGRYAYAPGLAAGFLVATSGVGALGSWFAALIASLITIGVVRGLRNVLTPYEGLKQAILYPISTIFFTVVFTMYLVVMPIQAGGVWFAQALSDAAIGGNESLIAALANVVHIDTGGTFVRSYFTMISGGLSNNPYMIIAAGVTAAMTAPIGLGLSALIFRKRYSYAE